MAVDAAATHNAIRSRFKTQIEDVRSVSVTYDNGPDTHPDDETWIRFTIRPGGSAAIEVGPSSPVRTVGVAIAQIFVPVEAGDKVGLDHATAILAAFSQQTAGGVQYKTPTWRVVGREPRDSKWWQINVTCPFECESS